MHLKRYGIFFLFCLAMFAPVQAGIVLPALLGDNMVLKQKSNVMFWGWDAPGTDITVKAEWNGKEYAAKADADGRWEVKLSTPSAGGPFRIWVKGTDEVVLENVMVGEVWFTSGQSNMGWTVTEERNAENVLKDARHDRIRLFHVPRCVSDEQETGFGKNAAWRMCDAESVKNFSAMSYYFAVELQEQLDVPVGIISASWAGTGIESWLSGELQASGGELSKPIRRWAAWEKSYRADSAKYANELAVWKERTQAGEQLPQVKKPKSVHMMERPHCKPGSLYNAMVHPCMPYTLSGFIWYQGENSIEWSEEYDFQLQNLIESWREGFGSQAPFLVGQLTNFNYPSAERAAMVRDAQLKAEEIPGVYTICTIDIGNPDDVHPDNKLPFGQRFAGMALNKVYGKSSMSVEYPIAHHAKVKKDRVVVSFKRAKGLHVKGEALNDVVLYDGEGNRLEIEDAFIEKGRLAVVAENIHEAAKVTYAVDNGVKANLYNGNGLPAFPFSLTIKH